MMPATVPTACSWSGVGSSSWGARCRIVPSGRWLRAASWAAAMVRIRPRLSGTTTPGNSTTLRTGTMTIASSGIGGMSVPRSAAAADLEPAGWQLDLALEASIGNLEAPDHGAPGLAWHRSQGGHDQRAAVDHDLHLVGRDAG